MININTSGEKNNFSYKTKAYIASGFFNPEQLEVVSNIEEILEEAEIEYYSPRKCGVNIMVSDKFSNKDIEFNFKRSICNANNISIMDKVDLGIVNLCGKEDIGTLFEYGYMLYYMISTRATKVITVSDKSVFNLEVKEVIQEYYNKVRKVNLGSQSNREVSEIIYSCDESKYTSDIDALTSMMVEYNNSEFIFKGKRIIDIGESKYWRAGIVMIGYLVRSCIFDPISNISFISPYVSKSNLMLTENVIQYKSMDDYKNGIKVNYESENIR